MTSGTLIRRSLRFHARAHLGVVLGTIIASAALIGALVVGDSVRESLRQRALARLGKIHFAAGTGERLFRADLGWRMVRATSYPSFAGGVPSAALLLPGTVARQDGTARANRVNILGVDPATWFWLGTREGLDAERQRLAQALPNPQFKVLPDYRNRVEPGELPNLPPKVLEEWRAGELLLVNQELARQLSVSEGDEVVVRVRKPSGLAQDAAIRLRESGSAALRLKVGPILVPGLQGEFSLVSGQTPPANAFLPLDVLARSAEVEGRANLLLAPALWQWHQAGFGRRAFTKAVGWLARVDRLRPTVFRLFLKSYPIQPVSTGEALADLETQLSRLWEIPDAGLSVRAVRTGPGETDPGQSWIEVTSSRVFLESKIAAAALTPRTRVLAPSRGTNSWDTADDVAASRFVTNGIGVLTYLANLIRSDQGATPYSMVTAAGPPYVPADLPPDEILVNQWLAEDLRVKPGDSLDVSYYVVDSGSRLIERTNTFRVRAVVPLAGPYADRGLMPEFPGVAKAESTHDWDTGFPLTHPIRDKDEAYWKRHRGTPKAFVSLKAGQTMWANRFGALTAVRYPVPADSASNACLRIVERNLLANLVPADLGLQFEPVREQALRGAAQAQDFGQLFLGFSFFLVIAALLLMALLFQFGLEQRVTEIGTLLALGFTPRQVRRLLLREGAALALVGGMAGALAGLVYAKAMLWGLATVWRGAVGAWDLEFHATPATLAIGIGTSTLIATMTIWLTLRRQARRPACALLAGDMELGRPGSKAGVPASAWWAIGTGTGGLAALGWALARGGPADAETFFTAGALLLTAGLAAVAAWLGVVEHRLRSARLTLPILGARGCARRRKRSVTTVALLASGAFLIAAIGAFRLDANQESARRSAGTGGFALIGQSTLPLLEDLNSRSGQESFGLDPREFAGTGVAAFRVRAGDEASCLNLNRAQKPRLVGVDPERLAGRFTFVRAAKGLDRSLGWRLLKTAENRRATQSPDAGGDDAVPAIGDANSIQWALGKKVGDTLDYTDERGKTFKLRLVGAVANSILQGSLVIEEAEFVKRFPSQSGYSYFLVDAPASQAAAVAAGLSRALQDLGLELIPATRQLNAFNAVQNTYLGTFQVLGGLGLLLGSAGLGVVVLRNVLERRGELGLLLAVGFRRRTLHWLVLSEHGVLLGLGLGVGLAGAAIAVLPALLSPAVELPWRSLCLTLVAVWLNGGLWTWLATRYALRGNLLQALRNE